MSSLPSTQHPPFRYVRTPEPVIFPVEAEVPESRRHLELRTALYLILKHALTGKGTVGSDQFVYWDPTNPRACLAPDAFFKLDVADVDFDTWKVWERGAPDVAVEITSRSDAAEDDWDEKLARYRKVGLKELVRFDPKDGRLRVWDSVEGDLVERTLEAGPAASTVVAYFWIVVTTPQGPSLRLAEDARGEHLAPTPEEHVRKRAADAAAAAEEEIQRLRAELDALRRK